MDLSLPTIKRLVALYRIASELQGSPPQTLSSAKLGQLLGVPSHTLRKDIANLGGVGTTGSGYNPQALCSAIAQRLGLHTPRKACIVGLGRLGSAVMHYERFGESGYSIVAGFDTNINRLETLRADFALYPVYEMAEVIRRQAIELALLCVPADAAGASAQALIGAGIRGILNFTPHNLGGGHQGVVIRNIDFLFECRMVSSLLTLQQQGSPLKSADTSFV
jgi:redox-sensing transcriptional repressor